MLKYLAITIFIFGLFYLLIPGPMSIEDIPGVPESVKSDEPGDTYQNPNIAGYYGDRRRAFVTNFYRSSFEKLNFGELRIPSIRLNHPPEEAFAYIRDQQRSTYLEQYLYPLRGYLFVNGYEPYDENGKKFDRQSVLLDFKGEVYPTKVTVRYYPVPLFNRIVLYVLYWTVGLAVFWLFKKSIQEKI